MNSDKLSRVITGLSETYKKEARGPTGKIRLLSTSTIAPHFKNKELKKAMFCTDYELTKARKHAQQHGPGASPKKEAPVKSFPIPPEDLAFVVDFIHHPDNTCRSSHRMASCEKKKSSWISELFGQDKQPVMWLKDGKSHLYEKYKKECLRVGNKPISESKFRDGLNAGNFREMVEMAGLCNICDEVGAKNWIRLNQVIESSRKEVSGIPAELSNEEKNQENWQEYDEDLDDLSHHVTTLTKIPHDFTCVNLHENST